MTSTEVSVSDKAAQAGEVVLPLDPSKPAADAGEAPAVEVKVPASVTAEAPVKVTVPVDADEPDYGVVVFAVDADGNETVLPKCGVDADGNVVFEAEGDVTVKVVDAASEFPDVAGTWYGKQGVADFVSARGILTGVPQADGALRFEGDAATTRAMFVTMLHRAESCPDAEGAGFDDAAGLWFEEAAAWGEATGVVDGYGGSSFGGDDPVTREAYGRVPHALRRAPGPGHLGPRRPVRVPRRLRGEPLGLPGHVLGGGRGPVLRPRRPARPDRRRHPRRGVRGRDALHQRALRVDIEPALSGAALRGGPFRFWVSRRLPSSTRCPSFGEIRPERGNGTAVPAFLR